MHPSVVQKGLEEHVGQPKILPDTGSSNTEKLGTEQKARLEVLLPTAQGVLQRVEDKMLALTIAAAARWQPNQNVHEADEIEAPVFGDEEFSSTLVVIEELAEVTFFSEIAKFYGLPDSVINEVVLSSLKETFIGPSSAKKNQVPFVVHKRHVPRGQQ